MEAIVNRGIQVLVPPDAGKRKGARPGWNGGAYAFMPRVPQTDTGEALYRKRQGMIERCPRTRGSTGASNASNDEEDPPAGRNGD